MGIYPTICPTLGADFFPYAAENVAHSRTRMVANLFAEAHKRNVPLMLASARVSVRASFAVLRPVTVGSVLWYAPYCSPTLDRAQTEEMRVVSSLWGPIRRVWRFTEISN